MLSSALLHHADLAHTGPRCACIIPKFPSIAAHFGGASERLHVANVGATDLAILLGNWGPVPPNDPLADINDDGDVGPADLAIVLGNWGPCE